MIYYGTKNWIGLREITPDLTNEQVKAVHSVLIEAHKIKHDWPNWPPLEHPFKMQHFKGKLCTYMAQLGDGTRIYAYIDFATNPATLTDLKIVMDSGHKDRSNEAIEKEMGFTREWLMGKLTELEFLNPL